MATSEPSESLLGFYLGYAETGPPSPHRDGDSPLTARFKPRNSVTGIQALCCRLKSIVARRAPWAMLVFVLPESLFAGAVCAP